MSISINTATVELSPEAKLTLIAHHEVAHAVMLKLCGMPATRLEATEDGGLCHAPNRMMTSEAHMLYTLAGVAYETGCGLGEMIWANTHMQDMRDATSLIQKCDVLRYVFDPVTMELRRAENDYEALNFWLKKAGEYLWPHLDTIETVGDILAKAKVLSARRVAALLRAADIEMRMNGLR